MTKQKGGDVRIGISGWRYPPWRGVFYPPDLPQRRELEYASRQLRTVEINGSFYSLQTPESYRAWHDATPADFLFSVKGGRYITHMRRLRGVGDAACQLLRVRCCEPAREARSVPLAAAPHAALRRNSRRATRDD